MDGLVTRCSECAPVLRNGDYRYNVLEDAKVTIWSFFFDGEIKAKIVLDPRAQSAVFWGEQRAKTASEVPSHG